MDHKQQAPTPIATGFNFEPLPDGTVRIEFLGDDGTTLNRQVVSGEVVRRLPLVAALTDAALKHGPGVAREIMEKLNEAGGRGQTTWEAGKEA
jgi:hypothetical protein